MSKSRLELTDPAEVVVADQIQVRLARPEEQARWDAVMEEHQAPLPEERTDGG